MDRITALLIVRNEEAVLKACLDSLAGVVSHLAVVDTGSADGTRLVIENETCDDRFDHVSLEFRPFDNFAACRNHALTLVATPWTLSIDADELLSPTLREELLAALAEGTLDRADAWTLPFHNFVLGRLMTCRELTDQRHLRLFRTAGAQFDGEVHEAVILPDGADILELQGYVEHQTMRSWRDYLRKIDLYTRLEAGDGSRFYAVCHLPVALPATFWRIWVRRGCCRDGWPGFAWALTSGLGSLLRDWRRLTR